MDIKQEIIKWAIPIGIILLGVLIGFLVEVVIMRRLARLARRRGKKRWKGVAVLTKVLRRMPIIWFSLAGIDIASKFLQLSKENLDLIGKILLVVAIFSGVVMASRIAVGLIRLQAEKTSMPSVSLFANLTKVLVFVLGGLIILQTLGISITPILTALGVGGLAVALALQDTLSNFFAGLYIIGTRLVVPGDYVQLDSGQEGYVTDVSWRNTTIRAMQNNMIIIPNGKLSSSILTNFNQPVQELGVRLQVGVHYDSDLEMVERVTKEVAQEVMQTVPGGIPDSEPLVRFHTFGDSSINFTVIMKAGEFMDQFLVKHEFVKRLHRRYKKEGIEIPFPIRTLYMHKDKGEA